MDGSNAAASDPAINILTGAGMLAPMKSVTDKRWRLCVAPMMDHTDRHCRYFHRLLAPSARLYTEMLTADAVVRGDPARLLAFSREEHPVALQLGGSDPELLAEAARRGEAAGYDEINLNVGCPSDRVQQGRFGACLMLEPSLVRDCVRTMRESVSIPVTVKTRIGVDERDDYEFLASFVRTVREGGCRVFLIHARKAWLSGLSPKENREIPPLHYERVRRLKRDFGDLVIVTNGGITNSGRALELMAQSDGVMLGRAAYHNPWLLTELEAALGGSPPASREQVVHAMVPYIRTHLAAGGRLAQVTRHMLGLFQGLPGARRWRRHLSERAHRAEADENVLLDALALVAPAQPARRSA